MISITTTTNSLAINSTTDSTITQFENLTLISDSSSTTSHSTIGSDDADNTLANLQNSIQQLKNMILPLTTKTQKKLTKVEEEIANCNFLIDSGIGSKKDQAALRKTKRQLRSRRIKLWEELKVLPALKGEKIELERQVKALRRQLGIMDDDI